MLRESMQSGGKEVDLRVVTQGIDDRVDVPHAVELAAFAEAVVARNPGAVAAARAKLRALLGDTAFVDAAATVAAFHGFVRIADAIGIPYTSAAGGRDVPELRAEAGIDRFHRIAADT